MQDHLPSADEIAAHIVALGRSVSLLDAADPDTADDLMANAMMIVSRLMPELAGSQAELMAEVARQKDVRELCRLGDIAQTAISAHQIDFNDRGCVITDAQGTVLYGPADPQECLDWRDKRIGVAVLEGG